MLRVIWRIPAFGKKIGKNYVESSHVRAALNYVARNDLEYGIVYKTEAIGNKNVKIVSSDKKNVNLF